MLPSIIFRIQKKYLIFCHPFIGIFYQFAHKGQTLLDHRATLTLTFQAYDTVVTDVNEYIALFTPSPMAHWLTAIPVSSPRNEAARVSLTSFI